MSKKKLKSFFREFIKNNSQKKVNSYKIDKIIINDLLKYIESNDVKNLMIYLPLNSEVNTYPLIKYLRKKKVNIYVPFMQGKSFILVKYRLPLKRKKFKIKEPYISKCKIKNIDLAVIPILGIDVTGRRVGFGKGMYDRFYEYSNIKIAKTVFIERNLFISEEVISDSHDIRSDIIFSNSVTFLKIM